ncbi:phospholipase A2-alpha-like isoform X1 [Apium graveolens]|uniref:phospholipase A2-alpha-like isoform X1 n=1 Tax=Apium graveolens TaxID=4045 RepID=UPI003D7A737E
MTPSKLLLVSFYFIHQLLFFYAPAPAPADALDLGIQADTRLSPGKHCSRTCESSFCSVAPLLRYGKYCGILYGGCPGEKPCDELDACCMKHDACIISKQNDYLNLECNLNLLNCVGNFKKARGTTFRGNTCEAADVIKVITVAMDAALLAVGHHPKP